MRKKVMAFNAKVNAWILKRLKALIWALATLLCLRRIQRIKKYEKEQTQSQNTEEK